MASITMYRNAGELPAMPVMASMYSSPTSAASPTAPSIDATLSRSSSVTEGPQQYPIAPSRTMQQWLGITLTFLAFGAYPAIFPSVRPATMLTSIFPSRSSPSSKTSGTCFGFTARTTISDSLQTSLAVPYMRMPWFPETLCLVDSLGAHATISSFTKTPLAMRPPMSASAIFPAPMKPMLADIAGTTPPSY